MKDYTSLSKFISLVLRHKPEEAGLQLDEHGWADVNELTEAINISLDELKYIVFTDKKGRYTFNDDMTKIRANQGHSIDVDIELEELEPPEKLYHGTCCRFIQGISTNGIQPKSRLYVHLSNDRQTASVVGSRHGAPIVLTILAHKAHEDGYKFYKSKNGVWLTKEVPVKYVVT